jgi:hypothetical protein
MAVLDRSFELKGHGWQRHPLLENAVRKFGQGIAV